MLYEWHGRYRLSVGRSGSVWLFGSSLGCSFAFDAEARSLRCTVADLEDPAWMDVLARRVLPRIAILCGAAVVHAASAAREGGAVMLVGDSGAGKSTLSAALGRAGWDVLSDDITALWIDREVAAAPSTTGMCVWPDSRRALRLPQDACEPLPAYDDKVRFVPGGEDRVETVPLKAIVLLKRSPERADVRLDRLDASPALVEIARRRIRVNPSDPLGREERETFTRLGRMAERVPGHVLRYPADYAALPAMTAQLQSLVRD